MIYILYIKVAQLIECETGDRRVASLSLTAIVSLSKRLCPLLSTGSTHKDLTLHDFKIVGWDKKKIIIYYAMKYRKTLIEYNA